MAHAYACNSCDGSLSFTERPPGLVYCIACGEPMQRIRPLQRIIESDCVQGGLMSVARMMRDNGRGNHRGR